MNKIKELAKQLETWLLQKAWVFNNLTVLQNYLAAILASMEVFHIRREMEESINSWPEAEVSKANKSTIRIIMDTVLKQALAEMPARGKNAAAEVTLKMHIGTNLAVARVIVSQLSRIVGVQPIQYPVSQLYMMRYVARDAEGDNAKQISLEIVAMAVEAASRKLQAGFTIEAMQDMKSMHGLDIAKEMQQLISGMIANEIVVEVIDDLLRLGTVVDLSALGLSAEAFFDASESNTNALAFEIQKAGSSIAHRTRRGAGNFAIVPPHVVSILQSNRHAVFKSSPPPSKSNFEDGLMYVGDFNSIKIYMSLSIGDNILVGYKGPYESDGGYFYAPYLPAINSGVVISPLTFQPSVGFMTRYSKAINKDVETAQEYYRVLKLDSVEPSPPVFITE